MKDNTIVILNADHGESLGEHNYYFVHDESIYDDSLRVPLVIKDGRASEGGNKISKAISSVDIVPTILSRVSPGWYFFNKNRFNGVDLNEIMKGKDITRKYIYSYFPWGRSIRDVARGIKYILYQDRREELFVLPDEHHNRINDKALQVAKEELRSNLRSWLRDYPLATDINSKKMSLDKDAKGWLKSLGYLQ